MCPLEETSSNIYFWNLNPKALDIVGHNDPQYKKTLLDVQE